MKFIIKAALAFAFALYFMGQGFAQQPNPEQLENILYLDIKGGRVAIQLRPDLAPKHVERAKKLAREGFYDGLKFHRVIEGFMAQSGDPTGSGLGSSKYPDLRAEFTREPFKRGTVGAARSPNNSHSANSQFFICFEASPFLNGQYTVWGQVIRGMRHVDAIKKGKPDSGAVSRPDKIKKMIVAADAKDHSVLREPPDPSTYAPSAADEQRGSFR